jgi:hypothetical protein
LALHEGQITAIGMANLTSTRWPIQYGACESWRPENPNEGFSE